MKKLIILVVIGLIFTFYMANTVRTQSVSVKEALQDLNRRGAPNKVFSDRDLAGKPSNTSGLLTNSQSSGSGGAGSGGGGVNLPYVYFWQYSLENQWALDFSTSFDFQETKVEVYWEGAKVMARTPEKVKLGNSPGASYRLEKWRSIWGSLDFDGKILKGLVEVVITPPRPDKPFFFYEKVEIPDFDFWLYNVYFVDQFFYSLVFKVQPLYNLKLAVDTQAEVYIPFLNWTASSAIFYDPNGSQVFEVWMPVADLLRLEDQSYNGPVLTTVTINGTSYTRGVYYWFPY